MGVEQKRKYSSAQLGLELGKNVTKANVTRIDIRYPLYTSTVLSNIVKPIINYNASSVILLSDFKIVMK